MNGLKDKSKLAKMERLAKGEPRLKGVSISSNGIRRVLYCLVLIVLVVVVRHVAEVYFTNTMFALKYKNGVAVFNERGYVLFSYPDDLRFKDKFLGSNETIRTYSLSPDNKQLLFISAIDVPVSSSPFPNPQRYELVLVNIANKSRTVLMETDGDIPILSPVWSRDGLNIALIKSEQIVMMDNTGKELWSSDIPNVNIHRSTPRGNAFGGYLQFSDDETRIFIHARHEPISGLDSYKLPNVATMDIQTKEVTWSTYIHMNYTYGKAHSRSNAGFSEDETEMIDALFGSSKNPVLYPSFSSDRKYYFYQTRREGFNSRTWIEGYSIEEDKVSDVKTIARYLYTE